MAAKKSATQHQRRGDWDKAENLLRWAFQACTNTSQGVNANEAYFCCSGLEWLSSQNTSPSIDVFRVLSSYKR